MPLLIQLLFVLVATASVAQTSGELSARYGYPDAERFVARPGISLMAGYAENGTVCELMIEPETSIQQSEDKQQSLATHTVFASTLTQFAISRSLIPMFRGYGENWIHHEYKGKRLSGIRLAISGLQEGW